MCGCGGSATPAPAFEILAPSPALVGVTSAAMAPRLSSSLAPATESERTFLGAEPFPWWLAVLIVGGFIVLGGKPQ
jgi:hypothetical protein